MSRGVQGLNPVSARPSSVAGHDKRRTPASVRVTPLLGEGDLAAAAPGELPSRLADLVGGLAVDELARIKLFFARFLRHSQGPLAGQPFVLAPFQERFVAELLPA